MKTDKGQIFFLFALGLCSLGLISLTDRFFFKLFETINPSLTILAELRLTSLSVIAVIFVLTKRFLRESSDGQKFQRRDLFLPTIWLICTAYFVLIKKVWVPELNTWIDYVAFMVTGLLAEELLFRGALFDLSGEAFGYKKIARFSAPIWITATLFSLQHLGYHGFALNAASLSQLSYTLVMGLIFGSLRQSSGQLWPVILLHVLNNSFTLFRNLF